MPTINLDLQGLEAVLNRIENVSARAADLRPLGNTLGLIFQGDVDERFNTSPGVRQTGTVYGGVTWEALSDAYLAANPKREGGQQLRDTGELLNSFVVGGAANIFQVDPDGAVFGSALEKAEFLNRKRPLIVVHDDLVTALGNAIALYVTEGIT